MANLANKAFAVSRNSVQLHCHQNFQNMLPYSPAKVSKGAKIRNRYNQVPHLIQDTNGKVTNSQ